MKGEKYPEIVVTDIAKNSREVIRVTLAEYRGSPTVGLWRFYCDGSGNLRPGKGGLVLGVHHLPALASALTSALDAARAAGRLPAE